jgi:Dioxygenase
MRPIRGSGRVTANAFRESPCCAGPQRKAPSHPIYSAHGPKPFQNPSAALGLGQDSNGRRLDGHRASCDGVWLDRIFHCSLTTDAIRFGRGVRIANSHIRDYTPKAPRFHTPAMLPRKPRERGSQLLFTGSVTDTEGISLPTAVIGVWRVDALGLYPQFDHGTVSLAATTSRDRSSQR